MEGRKNICTQTSSWSRVTQGRKNLRVVQVEEEGKSILKRRKEKRNGKFKVLQWIKKGGTERAAKKGVKTGRDLSEETKRKAIAWALRKIGARRAEELTLSARRGKKKKRKRTKRFDEQQKKGRLIRQVRHENICKNQERGTPRR